MSPLVIEAPTHAQLGFIKSLCAEYGWQHTEVVASKKEATEIIDAMKRGTYNPRRYDWNDDGVPF